MLVAGGDSIGVPLHHVQELCSSRPVWALLFQAELTALALPAHLHCVWVAL